MERFLNSGLVQVIGIILTALSTYWVAKFNRSGSKEVNQTTGWTSLTGALQKEVEVLRKEEDDTRAQIKELHAGNQDLARRVYVLERNRHRWKDWGRRVVEIMKERGIVIPNPPEPLEDTDPNMTGAS